MRIVMRGAGLDLRDLPDRVFGAQGDTGTRDVFFELRSHLGPRGPRDLTIASDPRQRDDAAVRARDDAAIKKSRAASSRPH
jgi:hypothetical protein